jgi:hypothetical protein
MSLPVRDPTLPKPVDGNVASRNPWAEAFDKLDPDEQKRFNQADNDLLGILKVVSKSPMQDERQAGLLQWLAQFPPNIRVPLRSEKKRKTTKGDV